MIWMEIIRFVKRDLFKRGYDKLITINNKLSHKFFFCSKDRGKMDFYEYLKK